MAIPNSGQVDRYIADRQRNFQRDAIDLLGAWVSEIEPVLVSFIPGVLVGVTAEGHDSGEIVLSDRIYVRMENVRRKEPRP